VKLKEPLGPEIPAGAVGIHHPIDPFAQYLDPVALRIVKGKSIKQARVGFHQVDPVAGFETIREIAVSEDALVPVVDKNDIPEPRRKTLSPTFQPRA
jgi:hypothetical protein